MALYLSLVVVLLLVGECDFSACADPQYLLLFSVNTVCVTHPLQAAMPLAPASLHAVPLACMCVGLLTALCGD